MFGSKGLKKRFQELEQRVLTLESRPPVIREVIGTPKRETQKRYQMPKTERDTIRREIVTLLSSRRMTMRQLAVMLNVSYRTISNNLAYLLAKGLVQKDQILYTNRGIYDRKKKFEPIPPKAEIHFVERNETYE